MDGGAWKAAVHGVAEGRARLSNFTFTFHFPALEKEMATHSSVLAWRIPGTAEPGGLPSTGSHRVRHDWSDLAAAAAYTQEAIIIVKTTSNYITPKSFFIPLFSFSLPHLPQTIIPRLTSIFCRILYKQNHIVCIFGAGRGWILSLSTIILRFIPICCGYNNSFLSLLSGIILNGYMTTCLAIHLLIDTWIVWSLW